MSGYGAGKPFGGREGAQQVLVPQLAAADATAPGPAPETQMPCAVSMAFHLPPCLQEAAERGFPAQAGQQRVMQSRPFLPPQLDASMALGGCQPRASRRVLGRAQCPGSGCCCWLGGDKALGRPRSRLCCSVLIQPRGVLPVAALPGPGMAQAGKRTRPPLHSRGHLCSGLTLRQTSALAQCCSRLKEKGRSSPVSPHRGS